MIEAVKSENFYAYSALNPQGKLEVQETEMKMQFDVQAILDKIDCYTYTDEDIRKIDESWMYQIKDKFDLSSEEVYELYKRGVDLEQLELQEVPYCKQACARFENSMDRMKTEDEGEKEEEASVEDKISLIIQENDSMYLNTLTSTGPVTVNSLYESNFKGAYKKGISAYKKEDVSNVLQLNGIEENSGSLWAADMLMMYDMGVDATALSRLQNIQQAVNALKAQETGSISGEKELMNDEGMVYSPEYIDRITDELGMVTDEHIEKLIEEKSEINIRQLRDSIHKNAKDALKQKPGEAGTDKEEKAAQEQAARSVQVDEVKRQILQITAKLTVEAAQKISGQMPLESSSLTAVADALNQMETDMALDALKSAQVPATQENVQIIADTMSAVNDMNAFFRETVHLQLETDETAPISEIQQALLKYRENETPVEKRFGESLSMVEDQIHRLLENQEIEADAVNIEAAKALIANKLEVSEENIEKIQAIVVKLNTFLEEMTPIQAARMIKEGIDPYHSTVDQLLGSMEGRKMAGLKNSIAEAIVEMRNSGQLNEEQEEGMIGLYRIIQAVNNDKAGVMGYLYKNELPMTIENLQLAAKYVKDKHKIRVTVDDSFGEREENVKEGRTARRLLKEAGKSGSQMAESIKALEEMQLPLDQENIGKITKMSAFLYPYIREQFKKDMGKFDGMNSLPESFLEKLEAVQKTSPQLLESMLEQEIPLTLNNIYWMEKITGDAGIYGRLLDENGLLKQKLPSDLDEFEEQLAQGYEEAESGKEKAVLKGDAAAYRNNKQLSELIQLQKQRIENEGLYQIPFVIEGERKLINLYVYPDTEESIKAADDTHLKALITYETKQLGKVKAYVEIKADQIGFKIEGENETADKVLSSHKEVLIEKLKLIGYHTKYSEYRMAEGAAAQEEQAAVFEKSGFEIMA